MSIVSIKKLDNSDRAAAEIAYQNPRAIDAARFPVEGLLAPVPFVQYVAARRLTPSFDSPSAHIIARAYLP